MVWYCWWITVTCRTISRSPHGLITPKRSTPSSMLSKLILTLSSSLTCPTSKLKLNKLLKHSWSRRAINKRNWSRKRRVDSARVGRKQMKAWVSRSSMSSKEVKRREASTMKLKKTSLIKDRSSSKGKRVLVKLTPTSFSVSLAIVSHRTQLDGSEAIITMMVRPSSLKTSTLVMRSKVLKRRRSHLQQNLKCQRRKWKAYSIKEDLINGRSCSERNFIV